MCNAMGGWKIIFSNSFFLIYSALVCLFRTTVQANPLSQLMCALTVHLLRVIIWKLITLVLHMYFFFFLLFCPLLMLNCFIWLPRFSTIVHKLASFLLVCSVLRPAVLFSLCYCTFWPICSLHIDSIDLFFVFFVPSGTLINLGLLCFSEGIQKWHIFIRYWMSRVCTEIFASKYNVRHFFLFRVSSFVYERCFCRCSVNHGVVWISRKSNGPWIIQKQSE